MTCVVRDSLRPAQSSTFRFPLKGRHAFREILDHPTPHFIRIYIRLGQLTSVGKNLMWGKSLLMTTHLPFETATSWATADSSFPTALACSISGSLPMLRIG